MTRPQVAVALGLWLVASVPVLAAAPKIEGITPFGARRGVESNVVVKGTNLGGDLRLIAPFGFRLGAPAASEPNAGSRTLALTVDGATPIGVYPVRVQTEEGLSNPFPFAVGQLPRVAEVEDNGTIATAQAVAVPAVVEGESAGNDVDFYRFAGKKGQKIVIDAQCARIGSGVDPSIRLTRAAGGFVASADDTPGLLTDARIVAVLPEDADYVVELSDSRYQGGGRPIYRLVMGAVPVAEEVYPLGGRAGETVGLELRGGTLSGPMPTPTLAVARVPISGVGWPLAWFRASEPGAGLDVESLPALAVGDAPEVREPADPAVGPVRGAVPVVFNGRIDPPGDEDRFTLAVSPGQRLRIAVEAADRGSALDGVLKVLNAKGDSLAQADDTITPPLVKPANNRNIGTVSADPTLDVVVPAGATELTLVLRDLSGHGGIGYPYRIHVGAGGPTFKLAVTETEAAIPRGGTAAVGVAVVRKGFDGPIALKVVNPPAGLTVRPGLMAGGQLAGAFTVSADAGAAFDVASLDVVGEGQGPDGPIVVRAETPVVFARQGGVTLNGLTQVGLAVATSRASAVALDTPDATIEVAHGFGATIPIKVARGDKGVGALAVSALNLPPGMTVPAATIAASAVEGSATASASIGSALGPATLVLIARGSIDGAERTLAAPAVTINVVRPAELAPGTPAVEIRPGATFAVRGAIVRKGAFKEPVTVKINGLPAGLKAEPATVAPDASEFAVTIVADPKAAPASAAATLVLAYQVDKKAYPETATPLSVKVLPAP